MAHLLGVCPILAAADIPAAVDWYCAHLGFERRAATAQFGAVERDGLVLHFWPCQERMIAENTSAYVLVDDVDGLHATFDGARAGGRLSEVADRAWGMREFYVWDPDGNLLRFGAPVAVTGPA